MTASSRSVRRLSAWTAVLVLGLGAGVAPAMADTKEFDDPVGDASAIDISHVRVVHRGAVVVKVRSEVPLATGQLYEFWIDAGDGPDPDYYVSFRANASFDDAVGRVASFGDRHPELVRCTGLRARADIFGDEPVALRVPRRCLDNPGSVRVAVRFKDETTDTADWAADRRTFGPWVKR